jgi:hypothetical protein
VSGIRRVIVGASGSPGRLQALRYAEGWPAPMMPPWYPFLPGCRPAVILPTGGRRVVTFAVSGRRTPVSGSGTRSAVWGEIPAGPSVPGGDGYSCRLASGIAGSKARS